MSSQSAPSINSNAYAFSSPVSRRTFGRALGVSAVGLALPACSAAANSEPQQDAATSTPSSPAMMAPTQNAESQGSLTPDAALTMLREGNARFVAGTPAQRDYGAQVAATAGGQYPFAVVLGCIDSRVPIETVFDQGIGDIFSARVAGNVVNGDLLGSMEFACNLAGSKAVVVLGHTACGAVKGAIAGAELGNLTGLVQRSNRPWPLWRVSVQRTTRSTWTGLPRSTFARYSTKSALTARCWPAWSKTVVSRWSGPCTTYPAVRCGSSRHISSSSPFGPPGLRPRGRGPGDGL